MLNFLLGITLTVSSLVLFRTNYFYTSMNRVFLGLYNTIALANVVAFDTEGALLDRPYFYKQGVEKDLQYYLQESLTSWEKVNYECLFSSSDGPLYKNYPDEVRIRIYCTSALNLKFDKTAYLTIRKD